MMHTAYSGVPYDLLQLNLTSQMLPAAGLYQTVLGMSRAAAMLTWSQSTLNSLP